MADVGIMCMGRISRGIIFVWACTGGELRWQTSRLLCWNESYDYRRSLCVHVDLYWSRKKKGVDTDIGILGSNVNCSKRQSSGSKKSKEQKSLIQLFDQLIEMHSRSSHICDAEGSKGHEAAPYQCLTFRYLNIFASSSSFFIISVPHSFHVNEQIAIWISNLSMPVKQVNLLRQRAIS